MDITPVLTEGAQLIQSYGAGLLRISGVEYHQSVLVFPNRTFVLNAVWGAETFSLLEQTKPEILLVGTGVRMTMLGAEPRAKLQTLGLSPEIMDTGAACRTFNILLGESRRAAAILTLE